MNKDDWSILTRTILGCCFDVMNELGVVFLEAVYKNALFLAIKEKGYQVETEKRFELKEKMLAYILLT